MAEFRRLFVLEVVTVLVVVLLLPTTAFAGEEDPKSVILEMSLTVDGETMSTPTVETLDGRPVELTSSTAGIDGTDDARLVEFELTPQLVADDEIIVSGSATGLIDGTAAVETEIDERVECRNSFSAGFELEQRDYQLDVRVVSGNAE